jgi:hypothetical protein
VPSKETKDDTDEVNTEVLIPGQLYSECAVVKLSIREPPPTKMSENEDKASESKKPGNQADSPSNLGGETVGREVWECYEAALKVWEASDPEMKDIAKKLKEEQEKLRSAKGASEGSVPLGPNARR